MGSPRRAFMRAADHLLDAPGLEPAASAGTAIVPDQGSWQAVLASADLPDGAVHPFTLSTLTGFVERTAGQLRAVSGVCTHQGCRLVLAKAANELDCPCHNAAFALDGTVLRHRLTVQLTALPRIEVRESGGVVEVFAPQYPADGPAAPGE